MYFNHHAQHFIPNRKHIIIIVITIENTSIMYVYYTVYEVY
jgi:hypothetical protein